MVPIASHLLLFVGGFAPSSRKRFNQAYIFESPTQKWEKIHNYPLKVSGSCVCQIFWKRKNLDQERTKINYFFLVCFWTHRNASKLFDQSFAGKKVRLRLFLNPWNDFFPWDEIRNPIRNNMYRTVFFHHNRNMEWKRCTRWWYCWILWFWNTKMVKTQPHQSKNFENFSFFLRSQF